MKPENAARWLTILFRLNAVGLMTAALAVFLPNLWMQQTHAVLGLGEMPQAEVVEYLARSCSMLYFIHGLVLGYVSLNMRKYWDLVGFLSLLHLIMGTFVFGIDLKSGMPVYWIVIEGPSIMVFACVMLGLWKRASGVNLEPEN